MSSSDQAHREIHYTLARGEYVLRVYGAHPSCPACAVKIRVDHPGELTLTPPEGTTIEIEETRAW